MEYLETTDSQLWGFRWYSPRPIFAMKLFHKKRNDYRYLFFEKLTNVDLKSFLEKAIVAIKTEWQCCKKFETASII